MDVKDYRDYEVVSIGIAVWLCIELLLIDDLKI